MQASASAGPVYTFQGYDLHRPQHHQFVSKDCLMYSSSIKVFVLVNGNAGLSFGMELESLRNFSKSDPSGRNEAKWISRLKPFANEGFDGPHSHPHSFFRRTVVFSCGAALPQIKHITYHVAIPKIRFLTGSSQ